MQHFETYSYQRQQKRRKTGRAFLASLVLHVLAIGLVSISYIRWYRPMQPTALLTSEAISVTSVRRFHVNSTQKRSMPRTLRRTPVPAQTEPAANPNVVSHRPSVPPAVAPALQTDARLPIAETDLSEQTPDTPTWKPLSTERTQAPRLAPQPKPQQLNTETDTAADVLQRSGAPPIDRDARMGEALEGIAESVAAGEAERAVDLVFLLDISGSMIDNIRAVGRQLQQMVTVFEKEGVDFTLGIVIFRYLDSDTIIHPQTRDAEKYKRLLTSHVVAAAGDERAHNAIMKTIRRVNFREDADRRFVLVTDEASKGSFTLPEVLAHCFQYNITVDVIGINHTTHRALTTKTGGLWFPIPIQE